MQIMLSFLDNPDDPDTSCVNELEVPPFTVDEDDG